MQRFSTVIKPPDIGKNMGKILKKKIKKKGASLADTEDDYEYEQQGDTASGNTADDNWADWSQESGAASNQHRRPARRTSLAGKIVDEWKKKKAQGGTANDDDDDMEGYENPFADGADGNFDDMSVNYGQDDVSVDVTYLEDDGAGRQQVFQEQMLSPMSALRKGQKSKQKTKEVKKMLDTMSTLDEGSSDEEDDSSSKGAATGESSSESEDEYDDFFKYLDKEKLDDSNSKDEDKPEEEPVEHEPVKKKKKKKKPKKKGDGAPTKKKKKKKKVKKKKDDDTGFTTSDLLGMVSPEAPEDRKKVGAEETESSPLPTAPSLDDVELSDLEDEPLKKEDPTKKVDHHAARRALARLSTPAGDNGGLGGLALDAKMGDSRVDRAARRAIRRSSIGGVMSVGERPPIPDGKSRFDQILDGKVSDRQRYRRKSMDLDIRLSEEESEQLKDRVANGRSAEQTARPRFRRKSMDVRLSAADSDALRKKIDKSMNLALN